MINFCSTDVVAQSSPQYIFLVRHAEKANDGTKDPPLTQEGEIRAERLAHVLKSFDISAVYSTDYQRTRDTANPIANASEVDVQLYDPRSDMIIDALSSHNGNILIVGHSNSTPTLCNRIIGKEKYQKLDESVYTQLFIISKIDGYYGSAISEY